MKNSVINGYLVVYMPEHCRFSFHPDDGWDYVPTIHKHKIYRGMERYPWEDLDAAYYFDPRLSKELKEIRGQIDDSLKWLVAGIRLSRDLEEAIRVLDFSNQNTPATVRSEQLGR